MVTETIGYGLTDHLIEKLIETLIEKIKTAACGG